MEAPKGSQKLLVTSKLLDDGFEITSLGVIRIRNWFVRVSTTSFDSICVVMTHQDLGLTQVGFFMDEIKAHKYIMTVASDA